MNKSAIAAAIAVLLLLLAGNVFALDFWRYPESADRDSIFAGVFGASFAVSASVTDNITDPDNFNASNFRFGLYSPEFYMDYVVPWGLPFSFGVSVNVLDPNALGFGIRPAYHINTGVAPLDLYLAYPLKIDFSALYKINAFDTGVFEYGLRIGARWRVFNFFYLNVETGYKMQSLHLGVSLKLI